MSTQLCSGPSPEPKDVHPFIDAAMLQDSSIVSSVVQKLLLNFVKRPRIPLNSSHPAFSDDGGPGVLQRVGSVAGNVDTLSHHFPSNNWSMPIFFIPNLTQVWQS
jgi:hypothetical protein